MLLNTSILATPQNWIRIPAMALLFMLALYFVLGLPSQIANFQSGETE